MGAPTPNAGGLPSCQAPADRSRGSCESCFLDSQCQTGYYCCPFMRKCVSSSSQSCFYPIAQCQPLCGGNACTAQGCECSGCANVGACKRFSWLTWANLRN